MKEPLENVNEVATSQSTKKKLEEIKLKIDETITVTVNSETVASTRFKPHKTIKEQAVESLQSRSSSLPQIIYNAPSTVASSMEIKEKKIRNKLVKAVKQQT